MLIYTEESISFWRKGQQKPFLLHLDAGSKESQLTDELKSRYKDTVNVLENVFRNCRYFQFHDTTMDAKIRKKGFLGDNKFLRSNAGNLAAFLHEIKLRKNGGAYYQCIVRYIRQVMPQFGDFVMEPTVVDGDYITLDWRERDSDHIFGVNQISDGTLRFMALATLLLQPPETMPSIIIIDEPELGLHPTAISILAGIIKKASEYAQVVIATQSPRLLDQFDADNVVVVECDEAGHTSMFRKLSSEELKEWEDEFTTSEL